MKIVIHCSDTPNGRPNTAEDIHRYHLENGWSGIGYHYVICVDGKVEAGRPEYWKGSHVKGHNTDSIGICMIGTDVYSNQQWESLRQLIGGLRFKYPDANVLGHRELDSKKTCPNFDVQNWLAYEFSQDISDN